MLEVGTNLAVMGCSSFAKWEYVQACSKLLDDLDVFDLPCRFLGTVDDLGESHGGDTKLIGKPVEPLAQPFGSILDDAKLYRSLSPVWSFYRSRSESRWTQ